MTANPDQPARRPVMIALAGAMLLAALGSSIATVALPTLVRAFETSAAAVQWVVLAYLLSITTTIVLAGKLGDMIGHRRSLVIGLVVFSGASILCAVAPTLGVLIAGRGLQGIGGAILMAMPLSIAREVVAKDRIGSAMGLFGTMSAIGTALGPSLGGMLIAGSGWRMAFVMLAISGACVLALTLRAIPAAATRSAPPSRRLDWPGAAVLAITLMLYALATMGGTTGLALPRGSLLVLACVALAVFMRIEARAASPLVPLAQLRDRRTAISLTMNLLIATVMMATLVVGPFYLSFGLGMGEVATGLVMAIGPMTAAVSGVPAGRMTDRIGVPATLMLGLIQTTIGLICLAWLPRLLGVVGYGLALMLLTPGFQLFLAANNTAVMLGAVDARRGMLSGLLGLSRNLGFMTGASVMSGLFIALLGPQGISGSTPAGIADAFTTTFLAAAGLSGGALLLAISGSHGRPRYPGWRRPVVPVSDEAPSTGTAHPAAAGQRSPHEGRPPQ